MRRPVLLSSLTVGRCFTLDVPPGGSEEPSGTEVKKATPILAPDRAWKVTAEEDGQVVAESAAGERRTFAPDTKVVEVPRQGWDQLARG
ncbi:MAG: hypothetical protein M9894_29440 [Planctomycetes bacterium]|nr:hypothetical protein [Planctomycetota bacterium]